MPVVVHTDQHAEYVRSQRNRIRIPARLQVRNAIAADSSIEEAPSGIWRIPQQWRGDQQRVSVAERAVGVRRGSGARPAAVGDGVALKKHGHAGVRSGSRFRHCCGALDRAERNRSRGGSSRGHEFPARHRVHYEEGEVG